MQEFPAFQEVYNKYPGQFEILSVAVDERNNPQGLVQQSGYSWKFVLSEGASAAYPSNSIPYTLFIDASGKIVDRHVGGMTAADFESRLLKAM